MEYYTGVLKKYAVFEGRARRKEYWMFFLFNLIISVILSIISSALDDKFNLIGNIYSLAVLIPSLAVAVRRLHDINKSGWWLLISLIPIIGWIWIIVLLAADGDANDNRFGSNPKGATVTPPVTPPTPTVTQ
jgi:uncharacterized membrane protein YhaH (DUF805 family)